MIRLSPRAERQLDDLLDHYDRRGRSEAGRTLLAALVQARDRIADPRTVGFSAPRPYPNLARPGRAWLKVGRYWFAYSTDAPQTILFIFHDSADIPGRI